MDPNTVGADVYAANMELYARAVARKFGSSIDAWQTENEPNYAWITALADSRCSTLTGGVECTPASVSSVNNSNNSLQRNLRGRPSHDGAGVPGAALMVEGLARAAILQRSRARGASVSGTSSSWLIPLIGQWANSTVVAMSIAALRRGILAESPKAMTAVNFMADVPVDASLATNEPHWTDLAT